MKSTMKLAGIIALVALIGFSFAACNNGTTDTTEFEGTWQMAGIDSGPSRFIFSGNSFTNTSKDPGSSLIRSYTGTFTFDAARITFSTESGTSWSFTYTFSVEDGLGEYVYFDNLERIVGGWGGWTGRYYKQ